VTGMNLAKLCGILIVGGIGWDWKHLATNLVAGRMQERVGRRLRMRNQSDSIICQNLFNEVLSMT
jgi:hypothetical protein